MVTILDLSSRKVSGRFADLQSVYEAMYAMHAGSGDGFATFLVEHSQ